MTALESAQGRKYDPHPLAGLDDCERSNMKFPKQIYVKREYGTSNEESWLIAQASLGGIVEADDEETVAIYQLIKTVKATAKTVIK